MRLPTFLFYFFLLLIIASVCFADNRITVDQVGSNSTYNIDQVGNGHNITLNIGLASDADGTTLTVLQQGTGAKTATVSIPSGINNGVNIQQDGAGNHIASIQNLTGSGNNITINQSGAGKHEFNVINGTGAANSGNTISGNQSGGVGADKWFNVNLNGATGATVNVVQDNATTAGQASMNVQCMAGTCGAFNYISH